jgi:hypothetical protein
MKLKFWPLVIASLSLSGCGSDFTWFPTNTNTTTPVPTTPTLNAVISPTSVANGGTSTITYTILNKTGLPNLTGLGFSELFPTGVTPTIVTASQCGGTLEVSSNKQDIIFSGGSIASGLASCTITATLTGTNAGATALPIAVNHSSIIGTLVGSAGLVNIATNQTVTVAPAPLTAPTLTASLSQAAFLDGNSSTLTFTINNASGNPAQTGLSFVEQLPTNLTATTTASQCGGTVEVNGSRIIFQNGLLDLNSPNCKITADLSLGAALNNILTTTDTFTIKSTDFSLLQGGLVNGLTTDLTLTAYPLVVTSGGVTANGLVVNDTSTSTSGIFTISVDTQNINANSANVTVSVVAMDVNGSQIASTLSTFSGTLPAAGTTQISLSSSTPTVVLASDKAKIKFWRIVSVTVT